MAFSPGMAIGLARGLQDYQDTLEKKRLEAKADEKDAYAKQWAEDDRTYNRGRNAVADQQTAQSFNQQQLATGLAIGAAQRKDAKDIQDEQNRKKFGDIYVQSKLGNHQAALDLINSQIKPGINTQQVQRYDLSPDGKVFLNTYDSSDLTKPIGQGKETSLDNLVQSAYGFYNPTGSWESELAQKVKFAEEQRAAAAENAKAERDHGYAVQLKQLDGQNTRANSLFNAELNIQRDGINWDRKDAYAQQNPSGTSSKSAGVPQFSFSQAQPSDLMGFLIGRESGGVHRTAAGGLLTSPKGAQGIAQIMPDTGVSPGYGVKPVQNNTEAEHRRFGQDYLSAMYAEFGNDPEKALAAYNAGPKRLQQGMAAAQKSGKPWLSHMPSETQNYVASIKQKYNQRYAKAISQQISSTVAPLTTQILNDFKGVKNDLGVEVVNGAQVRGALTNAATLLNKAVAASDPNQKIKFYNDAGTSIALALTGTGLSEQQITDYKNNILTAMVGEGSNFSGVADKVGWRNVKPPQVDPEIEAAINGTGQSNKPAATTQAAKPPAPAQPSIATVLAATTNAPKPHRMQLDAVKKEISVIQSAIKSGQASPLQQAKFNERLKDLTKALPDSRHISLSDTVGAVTEPFRFKLQTGLSGGAGSAQSNSPAVDNQVNMEARKQLGL
jgi:hypothetical protein